MSYDYFSFGNTSSWYTPTPDRYEPPVIDPYAYDAPTYGNPWSNPLGVDTYNGDPGSQNDVYDPMTGDSTRISRRGNLVVDSPDGAETVYTRDGRVINERNPRWYSGY